MYHHQLLQRGRHQTGRPAGLRVREGVQRRERPLGTDDQRIFHVRPEHPPRRPAHRYAAQTLQGRPADAAVPHGDQHDVHRRPDEERQTQQDPVPGSPRRPLLGDRPVRRHRHHPVFREDRGRGGHHPPVHRRLGQVCIVI